MKPINEIVMDLEARGFVLLEGLKWAQGIPRSDRTTFVAGKTGRWESIADAIAIDAIACEFARQVYPAKESWDGTTLKQFDDAMSVGRTKAALRALWEATG